MAPVKQSEGHLRAEAPRSEGEIPPPVQVAPPLPKPRPTVRPETYSVVVNNVRVDDLLFALARDAKINVDIHPGVTGTVTLNAIDQTLPQLLNRIARQVDMRYEVDGANLMVMRDTPFLRAYKVDYVSASRNVKMQSTASTQFSSAGAGASGGGSSAGATGSTATIDVASTNQLWDAIVQNLRDIIQEAPAGIRPATAGAPAVPQQAAPTQPAPTAQTASGVQTTVSPQPGQTSPAFGVATSVIGNRESGVLFVRATSRQHEKVQEFLDQVLASVKRQVLIEATIVEVQLNNNYQRGIDWSRLRAPGASGFQFQQSSAGTPANVNTNAFVFGYATAGLNFTSALKLLESFGDVKVLSSPKISVLNNQTALLRVTRDIVYFTITPSITPLTIAGGSGNLTIQQSFTTTPNVAAEGFMMSVLPQINDADTIILNVRPTIRRRVAFATDPNPALAAATPNLIPIFETRELDSILRIQSGQTAVLGGLMQDSASNTEDGIPGRVAHPRHRRAVAAAPGHDHEDRTGDFPAQHRDPRCKHRRRLSRLPQPAARRGLHAPAEPGQTRAGRRSGEAVDGDEPAPRGTQEGRKGKGRSQAPRRSRLRARTAAWRPPVASRPVRATGISSRVTNCRTSHSPLRFSPRISRPRSPRRAVPPIRPRRSNSRASRRRDARHRPSGLPRLRRRPRSGPRQRTCSKPSSRNRTRSCPSTSRRACSAHSPSAPWCTSGCSCVHPRRWSTPTRRGPQTRRRSSHRCSPSPPRRRPNRRQPQPAVQIPGLPVGRAQPAAAAPEPAKPASAAIPAPPAPAPVAGHLHHRRSPRPGPRSRIRHPRRAHHEQPPPKQLARGNAPR